MGFNSALLSIYTLSLAVTICILAMPHSTTIYSKVHAFFNCKVGHSNTNIENEVNGLLLVLGFKSKISLNSFVFGGNWKFYLQSLT